MEHLINIPGRLNSVAVEKHIAGTDQIYDDLLETTLNILNLENITDVKVLDDKLQFLNIQGLVLTEISIASRTQSDWNQTDSTQVNFIKNKPTIYNKLEVDDLLLTKQDIIDDLAAIRSGAQTGATAYQKPSTGIPATDLANDVQNDLATIGTIEDVIPEQASSSNQLADKNFVNSSIATATATYRGAYNLVTDLSLTISATHAQIATALATAIQTVDNNDYCYVQIPVADATPTEFASVERYKFNGTEWTYEYTLNNSGFTAAQWSAINSGITSGLVAKLSALPDGYTAVDISYDNTRTGLSATNVQDAIDKMADTNLYETVVLTVGSADSSFNPVGQTITVTLEDGSATQYTVPISRQITFIVQRGMRYNISGTSTADYRVLPISVKAAIPTRYLTMRYIPIATGVFILQKDGNYYLREEYDAETMAEDAVGILVLTSALINAGFGIVLGKNDAYNSNTRVYVVTTTATETGYNGYNYTKILANAGDAPAVRCKNAMLELDDQTLTGFLPALNEALIIQSNRQEISLCIAAIGGVELRYDGNWSTSSAREYTNIGQRFRLASGGYIVAGNSQLTRPCYIYPIVTA